MTTANRAILDAAAENLRRLRATDRVGGQLFLPSLIFVGVEGGNAPSTSSREAEVSRPPATRPDDVSSAARSQSADTNADALHVLQAQIIKLKQQKSSLETKMQSQIQENEKLVADKNTQSGELTAALAELKHLTRQKAALAQQLRMKIGGSALPQSLPTSGRELRDTMQA